MINFHNMKPLLDDAPPSDRVPQIEDLPGQYLCPNGGPEGGASGKIGRLFFFRERGTIFRAVTFPAPVRYCLAFASES